MPTQRYAHRMSLLRYAPLFKALDAGRQDSLLTRLYAVHDACELPGLTAPSFVRR